MRVEEIHSPPPPPPTPLNTPLSFSHPSSNYTASELQLRLDEVRKRLASAPHWAVALGIAALPLGGLFICALCIGVPIALFTLPLWLPIVLLGALLTAPLWLPMLVIFILSIFSALAVIFILVFWDSLPLQLRSGLLQAKSNLKSLLRHLGHDSGGGE